MLTHLTIKGINRQTRDKRRRKKIDFQNKQKGMNPQKKKKKKSTSTNRIVSNFQHGAKHD